MNDTKTGRWGDFKTMSREDVDRVLYLRRCIMNAYERCNVYLGVRAAKDKAAESLAIRFYAIAKAQLDSATFQRLKQQAQTVGATPPRSEWQTPDSLREKQAANPHG